MAENVLPRRGGSCTGTSVQRGIGRSPVQAQVVRVSREAEDGAERGVAQAAVANGLPTDAILLGGEGQGGESSDKQFIQRAGEDVQAAAANPQTQVFEAEEIVVDSFGYTHVLAGARGAKSRRQSRDNRQQHRPRRCGPGAPLRRRHEPPAGGGGV